MATHEADSDQIMDKDAAVLGYPNDITAQLLADHCGLIQFQDREHANYQDVRNVLRFFLRQIQLRRIQEVGRSI